MMPLLMNEYIQQVAVAGYRHEISSVKKSSLPIAYLVGCCNYSLASRSSNVGYSSIALSHPGLQANLQSGMTTVEFKVIPQPVLAITSQFGGVHD